MSFLRRFISSPTAATIPSGNRVYAVGDVHGCRDLLVALIQSIIEDSAVRAEAIVQIVFLGDLVDRGPDSRGVIELVIALHALGQVHLIKGNHEEIFVAASRGDRDAARQFFGVGGRETLRSYGISDNEAESGSFSELIELMGRRIPREHIDFLDAASDYLQIGGYIFVHAGLRPGVPLQHQSLREMRWIGTEFTRSRRNHGGVVVHGHMISKEVEMRPNRIGVDTGAYTSGRLSAIGLEGTERWVVSAES